MSLTVTPLRDDLPYGARVHGVSHASLEDDHVRDQLRAVFDDRGLIVFEDVEPSDALQIAVSRMFGRLKDYRAKGSSTEAIIEQLTATPGTSTVVELAGRQLAGWLPWHFDQCYNDRPNRARVLRCEQAPAAGGLTGFLDSVALYAAMPRALRDQIEGRRVMYERDLYLSRIRFGRPPGFRVVREAAKPSLPVVLRASHPAVVTDGSGGKRLHVSPWMALGLVGDDGAPDPHGDELLEAVSQDIGRLGAAAYAHAWRPTDLLIWDNLRVLHSAAGCDAADTRIMRRTTILDD